MPIYFFFALATDTLTEEAQHVNLDELARVAASYRLAVRVTGAADSATGTRLINDSLSASRAEYIASQLASKLIDNMITNQEYSSAIVPGKKYLNGVIKTSLGDENLVNCDFNTFSKGMMQAFAYHRPVVLSPDMIWLLISQAFAHHINLNADELRDRIVEHEVKMLLTAVSDVDLLADPDHVDWNYIFTDFENMISANTKNGIAELVTADFSTTGPTEKIASQITLMESVKSYFEYEVMYTVCGIPDVTLLGTPDDWRKVLQKASRLSGYGLDWWIEELDPVLEQFVRAFEGLKRFNHIYSLEIDMGLSLWDFPEWFNDIKIDKLKIKGVVLDRFDEKRLKGFRKKYPDAEFDITIQKLDNN